MHYQPRAFKWRHYQGDIILQCVRWYCKYGISYRDLEEMMSERGVSVDHTTLYRWVQHYAPELKKRVEWYQHRNCNRWFLDETYIKVKGQWKYLYRAIDSRGNTLDFYLSHRRSAKAAKRFIGKLLKQSKYFHPQKINTDKNPAYGEAISQLRAEGKLRPDVEHRKVKYLNNRLESDHGKLKILIKPMRGFQSMKTAFATIKGFEVMRMFRKKQFTSWMQGSCNEVTFINELFDVYC